MTYELFWIEDPSLAIAYRRAEELRKKRLNEELWLAGIYTSEALASTVGNMFSKQKYKYPSEPKPITLAEVEERKAREEKLKMEKMKAKFTARALNINARKGGGESDH